MIEAIRGDSAALGRAYHSLFMGEDTDEAEAAARHFGYWVEMQLADRKVTFGS